MKHALITSPFLLPETRCSLAHLQLQRLWRPSEQRIQEYIALLEGMSEIVDPLIERLVVLKDPNDGPVV